MNLSPNFTLEEFIHSQTASRRGIDNTPSADAIEKMKAVAATLELLRARLDAPIIITSGYRSPALNAITKKSSKNSAHTRGAAADFIAPAYGEPLKICKEILNMGLMFDQLIYEHSCWVHLAIEAPMRRQVMTYRDDKPINGLVE